MKSEREKYTGEELTTAIDHLNLGSNYRIESYGNVFIVAFVSKYGNYSIDVSLKLELNVIETYNHSPTFTIRNIVGFNINVSKFQISEIEIAKNFLVQYLDAMKVANLFEELTEKRALLIGNR